MILCLQKNAHLCFNHIYFTVVYVSDAKFLDLKRGQCREHYVIFYNHPLRDMAADD